MTRKKAARTPMGYVKIFGPGLFVLAIGFLLAYQFVRPAPPRQITIAAGGAQGAYAAFANRYREILARDGIALTVRTTAGSAENIPLLENPQNHVEIAFLQGGTGTLARTDRIVALGSLYYEPLWVFHRKSLKVKRLSELRGLRLAVGIDGSGTRILATKLLELSDVTDQNAKLISLGGDPAARSLAAGEIDAAFFVMSPVAPIVEKLLTDPAVRLMNLEHIDAYAARLKYLSPLTLPKGAINLAADIPAEDVRLIAPTAQLIASTEFHPALIDLFLTAAREVHGPGGLFEPAGRFPSPQHLDFPLSRDAARFYASGLPFLRRYLPFWVATFVDRMKVMLVPLFALLFPLFKIMPPIYRWRVRYRIYRWYRELALVDLDYHEKDIREHLDDSLARLDQIEDQVVNTSVPLGYAEKLYDLRLHIELLRRKLEKAGADRCAR